MLGMRYTWVKQCSWYNLGLHTAKDSVNYMPLAKWIYIRDKSTLKIKLEWKRTERKLTML